MAIIPDCIPPSILNPPAKMSALSILARAAQPHLNSLMKRKKSWPRRNPGVMLVFCIVFIIVTGLLSLFIYRKIVARRDKRLGETV